MYTLRQFPAAEVLARIFGTVNPLLNLERTWNMAPTRDAPVVRLSREGFHEGPQEGAQTDQCQIGDHRTIAKSSMFKEAFARRRCLVPAPVYYEWRDDPDGKTPFAVARVDGDPVAFGGIWEAWRSPEGERLQTFATITAVANELLASIQDRMPVIIEKTDWPVWLGEAEGDPAALLRPAPNDVLRFWQVDKKVGNVRNDGPDLIKPIAEA
jgi:putative SOS response-associated peptidase YedK